MHPDEIQMEATHLESRTNIPSVSSLLSFLERSITLFCRVFKRASSSKILRSWALVDVEVWMEVLSRQLSPRPELGAGLRLRLSRRRRLSRRLRLGLRLRMLVRAAFSFSFPFLSRRRMESTCRIQKLGHPGVGFLRKIFRIFGPPGRLFIVNLKVFLWRRQQENGQEEGRKEKKRKKKRKKEHTPNIAHNGGVILRPVNVNLKERLQIFLRDIFISVGVADIPALNHCACAVSEEGDSHIKSRSRHVWL